MDSPPSGPIFTWPPVAHGLSWAELLPLLVAAPAMVLLIQGIVRGRLPQAAGAAAVVVLPLTAYLLGVMLLMEDSKQVQFCGSCHLMTPIVESLNRDDGDLASLHYRHGRVSHTDACFVCHSGYGIWGTVGAKIAGLRHMLHTVTGRYEQPLKLSGTFDIGSCLTCHAQAASFREVEAHQAPDLQEALMSGEMSCTGICHPSAHPDDAIAAGAPAS